MMYFSNLYIFLGKENLTLKVSYSNPFWNVQMSDTVY